MIRRIFDTGLGGKQVLVTVEGDQVSCALRDESWMSWGPPLLCSRVDDDPPEAKKRYNTDDDGGDDADAVATAED